MTYSEARNIVEAVALELRTTLTLGYIGNCSTTFDATRPQGYPHNYDDRSWMVWFKDFPRGEPFARYSNTPELYIGPRADFEALEPTDLRTRLYARHARFAELLAEREEEAGRV